MVENIFEELNFEAYTVGRNVLKEEKPSLVLPSNWIKINFRPQ
jgi:hypothetical protein